MSKIEVTKEQADAFEIALEDRGAERLLLLHARTDQPWGDEYQPLNDLSMTEMASMVTNGYTIAKSPEELIREYYDNLIHDNWDNPRDSMEYQRASASMSATVFVLNTLGIKVPGVND